MNTSAMTRAALIDALFATFHRADAAGMSPVRESTLAPCPQREAHLSRLLHIAKELLLRDLQRDLHGEPLMSSPQQLRDWLRIRFAGLGHEVFLVVFLDAHHRVLDVDAMFRGTLTQTSVYPREVVKAALVRNAAAVAFAHNHPSGDPSPSRADEALTSTLKSALSMIDVRVVDHFIVAGHQWLSMAERGLV